jgi:hypothetical protein
MQQVEENVASAATSHVSPLTQDELALISRVQEAYRQLEPAQAA